METRAIALEYEAQQGDYILRSSYWSELLQQLSTFPYFISIMANVSQQIPRVPLSGGISQQPDYNKAPGALSRDLINGYPDITYGLRKRPGLKYEFQPRRIKNNLQDGKWFAVARPGSFPYFGVILPGDKIRIWNAATRQELSTSSNFDYLAKNDKVTPLHKSTL